MTQGAVSQLLGGKRRSSALDYYQRVAALFGLSLSQLFADLELRVAMRRDPDTRLDPATIRLPIRLPMEASTREQLQRLREELREERERIRTILEALQRLLLLEVKEDEEESSP